MLGSPLHLCGPAGQARELGGARPSCPCCGTSRSLGTPLHWWGPAARARRSSWQQRAAFFSLAAGSRWRPGSSATRCGTAPAAAHAHPQEGARCAPSVPRRAAGRRSARWMLMSRAAPVPERTGAARGSGQMVLSLILRCHSRCPPLGRPPLGLASPVCLRHTGMSRHATTAQVPQHLGARSRWWGWQKLGARFLCCVFVPYCAKRIGGEGAAAEPNDNPICPEPCKRLSGATQALKCTVQIGLSAS